MCHLVKNESACPRCHQHFYIRLVYCKFAQGQGEDRIWGTCAFFEHAFPEVYAIQCAVDVSQDPEAIWRLDPKVQEPLDSKAVIRALNVGPTLCNICMGIDQGELPSNGCEDDEEPDGDDDRGDIQGVVHDHETGQYVAALSASANSRTAMTNPGPDKNPVDETALPTPKRRQKKRKSRRKKSSKSQAIPKMNDTIFTPKHKDSQPSIQPFSSTEDIDSPREPGTPGLNSELGAFTADEVRSNSKQGLLPYISYRHASTQCDLSTEDETSTSTVRAQRTRLAEEVTISAQNAEELGYLEETGSLSREDLRSPGPAESDVFTQDSQRSGIPSSRTSVDDVALPLPKSYESWSDMVEDELVLEPCSQDLDITEAPWRALSTSDVEQRDRLKQLYPDLSDIIDSHPGPFDENAAVHESSASLPEDHMFMTRPDTSRDDNDNDQNSTPASPWTAFSGSGADDSSSLWLFQDHVYDLPKNEEQRKWTLLPRRTMKWKHWRSRKSGAQVKPDQETIWEFT